MSLRPKPTAAILSAEEAARAGHPLWCCPVCGGLNSARDPIVGAGWCQHETCAAARRLAKCRGIVTGPEILYPAAALERRPLVLA